MHVNCRVGGTVWSNKVQYEPLTDAMNFLPLWQQGPVLLRLASPTNLNAGTLLMCQRAMWTST